MERKVRTYTTESSSLSSQEAVASLDPLVQPFNDQDSKLVYTTRRQSSIFYVSIIDENIHEQNSNMITRCLVYMERFSGILYALLASFLFSCSNFVLVQLNIIIFDVLIIRFLCHH